MKNKKERRVIISLNSITCSGSMGIISAVNILNWHPEFVANLQMNYDIENIKKKNILFEV